MASRWFAKKCVSMPDFFHEGSVQVAGNLKGLEMCTATVESVCIYKTPLRQGPLQTLGAIMHHFLVVEVSALSHPTNGRRNGLLIQAEKANCIRDGENTGITVKDVYFVDQESVVVKHRVGDLNVSIPMAQLLQILTTHSADYDLVTDNCWSYADATCRALVEAFRELRPEEDGTVMDSHLQQIPTLIMPGDMAVTVVGYGLLVTTATCVTRYVYKRFFAEKKEEDDQN